MGVTVRIERIFTLRRARMARESVMSTPIFDQLLREMAQRAEPRVTAQEPQPGHEPDQPPSAPARRRHRAD
jgi:hypothetical protein